MNSCRITILKILVYLHSLALHFFCNRGVIACTKALMSVTSDLISETWELCPASWVSVGVMCFQRYPQIHHWSSKVVLWGYWLAIVSIARWMTPTHTTFHSPPLAALQCWGLSLCLGWHTTACQPLPSSWWLGQQLCWCSPLVSLPHSTPLTCPSGRWWCPHWPGRQTLGCPGGCEY